MAVSHEIKSQLAKLLATEDLMVEHKKVETACFNVHTRVLTLPMWEKASNEVYDMLVGHEVGHALYTPDENWFKNRKIPPQFVNIVEDVRIEKLMKRRYAGISKTFYRGYKELSEEDFFGIESEDVSKMNLADRVNLYFKIGSFCDISFREYDEMPIVRMIDGCETFDDVLLAAEVLYKFCKKEQPEQPETNTPQNQNGEEGESENTSSEQSEQQPGYSDPENQTKEGSSEESEVSNSVGNTGGDEEPEIKTMDNLEKSLKDLIDEMGQETAYYEIPKVNVENIIISNKEIHDKCDESWAGDPSEDFEWVDVKYNEFKRSTQKEVNYLVKEFECRKSADSYARATTSRTGILDTGKLHTYRYNEDLFKKVSIIPDGKNHGLVFVLDWSGSMADVMLDTVKQLFNLVWFCKKTNIPFDVYAFTNDYPNQKYIDDPKSCSEYRLGVFSIGRMFSLMNILTSKTNSRELEKQMKNIFRIVYSFRIYATYHIPIGMGLSGTPLNESLMCLHEILPKFKKENKLQKVQCVILTDGEGAPLKCYKEVQRPWEEEPRICEMWPSQNSFLRDRKTGNTYKLSDTYNHYANFTTVLLNNLRHRLTDVNFIGIRILPPREIGSFIAYCKNYSERDELAKIWKKEKSISLTNVGYHKYFGISATAISNNSEFSVNDSATKSQIKNAFAKSLKSKKMNKKILGEFVELIA
tara:strand:- start:801 stop:2894 length:2094 start_codon:yes stop_codon:yes gene_type:complete